MTIIIFLVDTSGSMNQRTYLGNTILDVAKSSIENFMKVVCEIYNALLLSFLRISDSESEPR